MQDGKGLDTSTIKCHDRKTSGEERSLLPWKVKEKKRKESICPLFSVLPRLGTEPSCLLGAGFFIEIMAFSKPDVEH